MSDYRVLVESPVLYNRSLWVICFTYGSLYMSIPILYVELKSHKSCNVTSPQKNWDTEIKNIHGYCEERGRGGINCASSFNETVNISSF